MRFSFLSAAVLAFASSVAAQDFFDSITSPTRDQMLVAGTPFDITWAPLKVDGTVKITLLEGNTNVTLADGPVIASGVTNQDGKYSWIPVDSGANTYGFRIDSETNTTLSEYSQPFHIKGTGAAQTTTIKLSTGPSYSSTTTSSIPPSSTVTVVSTSTSAKPTTSALPSSTITPSSNTTVITSVTTGTPSATLTTPTANSSPTATTNAAVAKIASGGLAVIGGLVVALAL